MKQKTRKDVTYFLCLVHWRSLASESHHGNCLRSQCYCSLAVRSRCRSDTRPNCYRPATIQQSPWASSNVFIFLIFFRSKVVALCSSWDILISLYSSVDPLHMQKVRSPSPSAEEYVVLILKFRDPSPSQFHTVGLSSELPALWLSYSNEKALHNTICNYCTSETLEGDIDISVHICSIFWEGGGWSRDQRPCSYST